VAKITVIAAAPNERFEDIESLGPDSYTWEEKVALAEECRSHLMTLQTEATSKKTETAKLLTEREPNTEGEMNTREEANIEG